MSTMDDGGPVFPHKEYSGMTTPGLSLRDHFATTGIDPGIRELNAKGDLSPESLAQFCYRFADAMLVARAAKKGGAA